MKISLVVPTYYCKPEYYNPNKKIESFYYFDHPTPLSREGTLGRLIESLRILKIPKEASLNVIVIPIGNSPDIQKESERRVSRVLKKVPDKFEIGLLTTSKLKKLEACTDKEIFKGLVGLKNYSKVRNLCILIPFILGSDVAILIDDDEIFEDPEFLKKATEFIGKKYGNETIQGITGYYLHPDPEDPRRYTYFFDMEFVPWWKRIGRVWSTSFYINKALKRTVNLEPRLKVSSFALGGNMVLSKKLIENVPFDPQIPRGEDMDYVLNAKLRGYSIYSDRNLSIKHLPKHGVGDWEKMRMNTLRFLLMRNKLRCQNLRGFKKVSLKELMPYPGEFLGGDLCLRIFFTDIFLSLDYLFRGKIKEFKRTLENILLFIKYLKNKKRRKNVLKKYSQFQKDWRRLIKDFDKKRENLLKSLGFCQD